MKKNSFSIRSALTTILFVVGFTALPAFAQQATLRLDSATTSPGGSVNLNMSLTTTGGAQPAGLQWTMNYPVSDIGTVSVLAGANANAASKTVTCAYNSGSTICVLFGVNSNIVSDGVLATATFGINSGTLDTLAPIQVTGVVVTDMNGNVIPSSATSGAIGISQPTAPTLTGLTCTPSNVTAPGSATCSVTVSGAALAGGATVALSSNNASTTVPPTVGVSAGQSSSSFTATVSALTSNQTALVTASMSGTSQTFTLTATAPAQISSLSCSPASLGSNSSAQCTVSLNKAALAASLVTLSSGSGALTVPASVTVAVNQSSATFPATTATVGSAQNVTVTATLNGITQSTSIGLTVPVQSGSLSCSPATVNASGTSTCTVSLTAAAPAGGTSVALSSNNASVTVPATISVPAGASSASFTASVGAVTAAQTATLTASAGGTSPSFVLSVTVPTWSISGSVSPSSMGSGTVLTLSGSSSATVTADASGNYSFSELKSGNYTITPARSGYTFTPASQSMAITTSNVTGMGFSVAQNPTTSSIAPDAGVWRDQAKASATITSPSFSTLSADELLLAFIATDYNSGTNTTVRSISGAGLTWVLAVRTNTQHGTSEIWRAFAATPKSNISVTASLSQRVAASMTVMSFTGTDSTGTDGSGAIGATASYNARSGAPSAKLVTTRNNSWIFGVGNDSDKAIARTPGAGQTLVHQYLASVGNTFWVQNQTAATPLSGTTVTINDTAPTSDRYNLSAIEILASPAPPPSGTHFGKALDQEISGTATVPATLSSTNLGSLQALGSTLVSIATGQASAACSPGGLASIVGAGLLTQSAQKANSFPLPTELAGVEVKVNSIAAPLLFVSDSQINFQCPAVPVGTPLSVTVENEGGLLSPPMLSEMQAAVPGLFTVGGTQQGVVLIANTNEIAMASNKAIPSRPALAGEYLTIYASGLGEPAEDVLPGEPALSNRTVGLKNKVTVVVGQSEITPEFAGLTLGTAGLYQVNLRLPDQVSIGDTIPVFIKVTLGDGTVFQSNTVAIAVQASSAISR